MNIIPSISLLAEATESAAGFQDAPSSLILASVAIVISAIVGLLAGFIIGVPVFFEVGVIILMPLAYGVARSARKPLLVFEPLRAGYRWAADRHHAFVMQGMADQARRQSASPSSQPA